MCEFIAVDSRMPGVQKHAILFRELGHFLFHTPETGITTNFHRVCCRTRKERKADVFALCARIPRTWIENRHAPELIDDEGFSAEMIAEKCEIGRRYGI